ncbi:hypothetical protein [Vibrio alfacsensis]|uniref:hypothetical protein n=1 Tax=Vibrio alfacsensis TaxID=1074311 RepID=UPI00406815D0
MQQLSQAKKDKEAVVLLLMAQQYLPDHKMVMDKAMLERRKATLKEKISIFAVNPRPIGGEKSPRNVCKVEFVRRG